VEARYSLLGDLLTSVLDKCTDCAKYTTGKKSFWLHSMDLRGDLGQMQACFGPIGYSVNLDAR
jgi:hypothetical protein